ncbi:hypothetical protein B0J14DRAFT_490381, partial [Halenospora varia]
LLVDIIDCFKKEQLVINSKRQLSRKVVNKDIQDTFKRLKMTPEHLCLIDAILTLPKTSLKNKY